MCCTHAVKLSDTFLEELKQLDWSDELDSKESPQVKPVRPVAAKTKQQGARELIGDPPAPPGIRSTYGSHHAH